MYRTNEYGLSDKRLKKNVKDIEDAGKLLSKLRPVQYDFKNKAFWGDSEQEIPKELKRSMKNQYGLIAQEVEEILPQFVSLDTTTRFKYLNHQSFIPILIKGMQEQKEKIDQLESMISSLNKKMGTLDQDSNTKLYQNIPNPFSTSTRIPYQLPENTLSASILLFDFNGTLQHEYPLTIANEGELQIDAKDFTLGIYHYMLIVDGAEESFKRMVIK